jgi:dipeptidyl aminopeptidase/acylaminoacyl peptidase
MSRPVEPDDLFRLQFLMGADLAPDGRSAVYALARSDQAANTEHHDLYLLDVETGESTRLTDGDEMNVGAAFSPDGKRIAFMSTRDGIPQIFEMSATGGEARAVTSLPMGVTSGPAWSPDGSRIAFTAGGQEAPRDPSLPYRVTRAIWRVDGIGPVDDAVQAVWVTDLDGGEPRPLTDVRSLAYQPVWAADGLSINYLISHDPDAPPMATQLRRVTLDGDIQVLAESGFILSHAACPDGRVAFVLGYEFGRLPGTKGDLWVLDPRTGVSERRAGGLDVGVGGILLMDMPPGMSMGSLVVSDNGSHAYAPVARGGQGTIHRFALDGPESWEPVVDGDRHAAPAAFAGGRLLFAGYSLFEPGDLYVLDEATGEERRLTSVNEAVTSELELPDLHHLSYAGPDGVPVEGWFLSPQGSAPPYPTVVGVHGGPHAGWGHIFNFDFQMFAGAGFGVLFVNQRGSTGYGDDFATVIHADQGNLDFADLMAGVDHAVERGLADNDRLGIFGLSAGGFMTGHAIAHTDRFKAACPENPGFNWFSIYGTSDSGLWAGPEMMGGHPHEAFDAYVRCSPVFAAHRATTPTLFLHHDNDYRSPSEQTEQYYAIMKANGQVAEMLRFPGTGHLGSLLGPPSHRAAQNEAMLEWMTRYLVEVPAG